LAGPAARLFRLLALHPGTDVTVPAAAALVAGTLGQVRGLFRELTAAGLASEYQPGRYGRHDLLGAYAGELLDLHEAASEREQAVHRLLDHHLRTAYAAADRLVPQPNTLALPAAAGRVDPQPLDGYQDALDWFTAERSTLVSLVGQAADAGFPVHAWQLARYLIPFLDTVGHWQDLAVTQHTALRAAQESDDLLGMAYTHRGLARVAYNDGYLDQALSHLEQALALFERHGDKFAMAHTCLQTSLVLNRLDEEQRALARAEEALTLFRAVADPAGEAHALLQTAFLLIFFGRCEEAISHTREAIGIYERAGDAHGRAGGFSALGYAYLKLGRYDDSIEKYQLCIQQFRDLGLLRDVARALINLGTTYQEAGRHDEADAVQREAHTLYEDMDTPDGVVKYG
jgi:tetratricopeptide (TPR) repeat protein